MFPLRSNRATHGARIDRYQRRLDRIRCVLDSMQPVTRFHWTGLLPLGIAVTTLVLVVGCSDDETITPPDVEDPRKTIATTMQELLAAYEARDIGRYSALFDSDFVFVFDPTDVVTDPDIPESWDWTAELAATSNMFESDRVEEVQVDFVIGNPVTADTADVGMREFPEGTMKVIATAVELSVDNRDPFGGENIIWRVAGDQAIFFLYPDSLEIVDGVPVWKIFEWRDKKIGPAPTIETTWGQIKAAYK